MGITEIDDYEVMYSANKYPPRIWLKNKGKYIGQLIFKPKGAVLPPDKVNPGDDWLYYHLDDFQNVLDLLRNEMPVFLSVGGAGAENGIRTNEEPVGEGER